ncbi:4'-phosphopantetheinyl transferase [Ceratobasidium sp. AG-I]|nr:4'-phosphopantetheinyl transferase [Ceratobasidium sp. AG-I]
MPILSIGVDICHLPRIARLASRERFAQRILSPTEARLFAGLQDGARERFLAVRWAVKESAYKALYPHVRLQWKLVSLLPPPASATKGGDKPALELDPSLGLSNTLKFHVSVSHDGEYVFATVLAETST